MTRYNLVLETTLNSGAVLRDVVHTGYDPKFADTLAGNLNASIRAAKHAAKLTIDTKAPADAPRIGDRFLLTLTPVVDIPEVAQGAEQPGPAVV